MLIYFAPCGISTECKSVEMQLTPLKETIPGDNWIFNKRYNCKRYKKQICYW